MIGRVPTFLIDATGAPQTEEDDDLIGVTLDEDEVPPIVQAWRAARAVTAAAARWNPDLHPRDHHGRFVSVGDLVHLLFGTDEVSGRITGIEKGMVTVDTDRGNVRVRPDQIRDSVDVHAVLHDVAKAKPDEVGTKSYLDLNLDESRLGRCYELAGKYVVEHPDTTLVHGSIQGMGNPRIGHAWVKLSDGQVWEPASDQAWDPIVFSAFFHPVEDQTYPADKGMVQMVKEGHWGPWGPSSGIGRDAKGDVVPATLDVPIGLMSDDEIWEIGNKSDIRAWHLTDKPDFKLDPTLVPDDNTFAIVERNRPGLFIGDPERWINGNGYLRPFVAEVDAPDAEQGRWGGESFAPGESFDTTKVLRVIPTDAYAREVYGDYGWIEREVGTTFDTGEPIVEPPWDAPLSAHYPFKGYTYNGPDVREMSDEDKQAHLVRWRQALTTFADGQYAPDEVGTSSALSTINASDIFDFRRGKDGVAHITHKNMATALDGAPTKEWVDPHSSDLRPCPRCMEYATQEILALEEVGTKAGVDTSGESGTLDSMDETAVDTNTTTHDIKVRYVGELQYKVEKLNKRAEKLGVEPMVLTISEPYLDTVKVEDPLRPGEYTDDSVEMVKVTLTGTTPQLPGGWKFLGAIEHNPAGHDLNLIHGDDPRLAAYRRAEPKCDHCGLKRPRGKTVIVEDAEGNLSQVGLACVKDYLGYNSRPDAWLDWAEEARSLTEFDEERGLYSGPTYSTDYALSVAVAAVRTNGFTPKSSYGNIPTADIVGELLNPKPRKSKYGLPQASKVQELADRVEVTDADKAKAAEVRAWVDAIDPEGSNTYLGNLHVRLAKTFLDDKDIGSLAAVPNAYDKDTERPDTFRFKHVEGGFKVIGPDANVGDIITVTKSGGTTSEVKITAIDGPGIYSFGDAVEPAGYWGEIGAKKEEFVAKVTEVKAIDGQYGISYLVKMVTPEGHILITFSSGAFGEQAEVGHVVRGTATVEEHKVSEYSGKPETKLKMVKAIDIDVPFVPIAEQPKFTKADREARLLAKIPEGGNYRPIKAEEKTAQALADKGLVTYDWEGVRRVEGADEVGGKSGVSTSLPEGAEPEITSVDTRDTESYLPTVHVTPYRTTTRQGDEIEVWEFYDNGPHISVEGFKIKKDGTPAARAQVLSGVEIPRNVRLALGSLPGNEHFLPKDEVGGKSAIDLGEPEIEIKVAKGVPFVDIDGQRNTNKSLWGYSITVNGKTTRESGYRTKAEALAAAEKTAERHRRWAAQAASEDEVGGKSGVSLPPGYTVEEGASPLDYHGVHPQRIALLDPNLTEAEGNYFPPGVAAFVDYSPEGDGTFIHYFTSRPSLEGRGLGRAVIDQLYSQTTGPVDWGDIMEDAAVHLYNTMVRDYPDRQQRGHNRARFYETLDVGVKQGLTFLHDTRLDADGDHEVATVTHLTNNIVHYRTPTAQRSEHLRDFPDVVGTVIDEPGTVSSMTVNLPRSELVAWSAEHPAEARILDHLDEAYLSDVLDTYGTWDPMVNALPSASYDPATGNAGLVEIAQRLFDEDTLSFDEALRVRRESVDLVPGQTSVDEVGTKSFVRTKKTPPGAHDDWVKAISNDADLDWSSDPEPMTPEGLKAEARRIADEAAQTS